MGTEKRARQKANRAKRLEQESKVEQRGKRRHLITMGLLAAAGLAIALYLLSLTGGDDVEAGDETTTTLDTVTESTIAEEPSAPESAVAAPEPGGSIDGPADCPAEDGSSERITSFTETPPSCTDSAKSYAATIETTSGTIEVELDPEAAPETVNNFVFLARYHFYDGAPFHRIVPDFVIQGGDAVGDPLGTGNPGYLIDEELPEEGDYEIGSVVMAKGPGSGSTGSQFFIVTGEAGAALPPEYSLFGTITEGLEVATAIEEIPTNELDQPTEEIYINSVTITES